MLLIIIALMADYLQLPEGHYIHVIVIISLLIALENEVQALQPLSSGYYLMALSRAGFSSSLQHDPASLYNSLI